MRNVFRKDHISPRSTPEPASCFDSVHTASKEIKIICSCKFRVLRQADDFMPVTEENT